MNSRPSEKPDVDAAIEAEMRTTAWGAEPVPPNYAGLPEEVKKQRSPSLLHESSTTIQVSRGTIQVPMPAECRMEMPGHVEARTRWVARETKILTEMGLSGRSGI